MGCDCRVSLFAAQSPSPTSNGASTTGTLALLFRLRSAFSADLFAAAPGCSAAMARRLQLSQRQCATNTRCVCAVCCLRLSFLTISVAILMLCVCRAPRSLRHATASSLRLSWNPCSKRDPLKRLSNKRSHDLRFCVYVVLPAHSVDQNAFNS